MPAEPGTCSQGKKSFRRKKLQSEIRKRHTCCAISATTPWPSAAPPLWTVTPTASPSLRSPGSKTTTKYNKSPKLASELSEFVGRCQRFNKTAQTSSKSKSDKYTFLPAF
uniref:Fms related receptor tyrosine kinase 1 n=1 Tax=Rousettus aegyptiacus TaxID=9407 RepID=A0A7J8DWX2_ROUAE|nr:fms related receptor tyrosine kinase 1 [Rousettus aegyptiacus]